MESKLKHYGILGMKWGVRRDVGPDGLVINRKMVSSDYKVSRQLKKVKAEKLSNAQLETINKRMQLERTYSVLKSQDVSKGRALVNRAMKSLGTQTFREYISASQGNRDFEWKRVFIGATPEILFPPKK